MKRSPILFLIAVCFVATVACGLVDDLVEPAATVAPPPTVADPAAPTPTSTGATASPAGANPTPTLAATPTATPATTLADLGPPPDTRDALIGWVAQARAAAVEPTEVCLALRDAGWQRADDTCQQADLTGDDEPEWLLTIDTTRLQEEDAMPPLEGHLGDFWVANQDGVVYQTHGPDADDFFSVAPTLVELADMTGDDLPEAVTVFVTCGAHTCYSNYQILSGHDGEIRSIVRPREEIEVADPEPIIALAYVDEERIEDATGDDLADLVIRGGIVGSVGAGIQRARTEVWAWDGEAIALERQEWQETEYRFHRLYNGNYAFSQDDYDVARAEYEAVITDAALEDIEWGGASAAQIRASVRQFAGFRLALLPLFSGDITEATRWRNWLQETYPDAPVTEAAGRLISDWQTNGNDLAAACRAVTDFLAGQENPTGQLQDMGYNNPSLTAESVCPLE